MDLNSEGHPAHGLSSQHSSIRSTGQRSNSALKTLWSSRGLIKIWLSFNIRSRYRQKVLGVLWIALLPITQALIFTLVFSQILRHGDLGVPFVSFYLSGIIGWSIFSNGMHKGMVAIESKREVIGHIYFPREILVIIQLAETLVDTAFMFLPLLLVNALNGIFPNVLFLLLPLILLIQLAMTLGLMLLVSNLCVLVRDSQPLTAVLIMLLFYLTPVIYPVAVLPAPVQLLVRLNPLSAIVEGYRSIILYGALPDFWALSYPALCSVVALVLGYLFFKKYEYRVVDLV